MPLWFFIRIVQNWANTSLGLHSYAITGLYLRAPHTQMARPSRCNLRHRQTPISTTENHAKRRGSLLPWILLKFGDFKVTVKENLNIFYMYFRYYLLLTLRCFQRSHKYRNKFYYLNVYRFELIQFTFYNRQASITLIYFIKFENNLKFTCYE